MTTTNAIQIVIDSTKEIPNNDKFALEVVDNIESDGIPTCRICMESQLEDSDPIIPLGCGCRHGLGQAHENCLIKWFCHRRYKSIFSFNGLPNYKKCEICRKTLSPSTQRLINGHWRPFFQEEFLKFIILQGNGRMAARRASRTQMTQRDTEYFLLGAIFMMVFVGFCISLSIYFLEI